MSITPPPGCGHWQTPAVRSDELRTQFRGAKPWWQAAATRTSPRASESSHRLLNSRQRSDLGYRSDILADVVHESNRESNDTQKRHRPGGRRAACGMMMYRDRMGADTAALVDQVLALPNRERDAFIAELLARLLEPAADEFVESDEWVREIERRLQGVVSGETVCEDWDVVEQRLLAKYPKV